MRILPVVAAVTAAFLVVACSSPTPPKGVTVVNNFDAKRYLGTGMRSHASIIDLNVDWNKSRPPMVCVTMAGLMSSIKAITRIGECGKTEGKAYFTGSPNRAALKVSFRPVLRRL